MPSQRASGQKQVIVVMKEDFLDVIDRNLEAMGFGDRAAFIRTAVLEKLGRAGHNLPVAMTTPPSRAGKGGRPPKIQTAMLNESTEVSELANAPLKPVKYPAGKTPGKRKPKAP